MEPFNVESRKWVNYIRRFRQHLIANNIDTSIYVSKLISIVGSECYELMVNLCKPSLPEEKSFEQLVEIMKNHLEPVQSVVARRHIFRHRYQKNGEDIIKYNQELRKLANVCDFGDKYEENLRDQLASGVSREDIRQQLFAKLDLTYDSAINICLAMETAQNCSREHNDVKKPTVLQATCWRCGRLPHHKPDECRYQQFPCNICNEIGHLMKMCPEGVRDKTLYRRIPNRRIIKKENRLSNKKDNVRVTFKMSK